MIAIDNARPPGRTSGEFDRSFDTFRAGIRKKDLIQIWHMAEQPFGQHAGKRGYVQLHEIRQVAVEHALQGIAQHRMVAANRKNAKSAEQVQVASAATIEEILTLTLLETN